MRQDLRKHRPDVLLHVMTPDQVRAGKEDFDTVKRLRSELGPIFPPVVYCLNKVDTHKKPDGAWPPEKNPELAGTIKENLDFAASVLGEEKKTPLRENQPLYGYQFDSENHIGIVPVSLIGNPWNVEDTLSWLVGDFLPNDARLQFGQGPGREDTIRRMCRDLTNRAAVIGAGVGATPAPVADMPVLLGIQGLLIGMIGALSCRSLSIKTVMEYTSVMGGTFALATAARAAARALIQLVPIGGWAVSAAIAYVTTYAIGRSAEVYYFEGKKKKPWKFMKEAIGKLREREEE
jgi:uncharacterized protein (DUF697 family)